MIAETRGKLIAAARDAFSRRGYAETSMDDFTASAGLTRGALYHHFGDKKGLLQAVVETLDAGMDVRLDAASEAADLWEGFVRRCKLYLEMALEPEIRQIVLKDAPAVLGASVLEPSRRQCLASLAARLSAMMAGGIVRQGDAETLARLINGALADAALWIAEADDPATRLASASDNLDLLLFGLKNEISA
ncbi:TetR/AcrR family transcriptional regulator [Ensifer adhaerens]|uniref:TetR/AcrR family transcriptional regulator n=1 Tax=Ensifer adhaerens TaxID=106592 RepID=UPI001CC155EA|nr:TetR/AcrR family transcriptional regulator [Ensifer adhaerens]MBZ7923518.1 TetR/AcrR family transcriptional regulator [Ensifer adhaerens]UAX92080.1 TetR/AcrR family transcriptional regulator [Ensifer adhaerens]UAX99712.1 TetR/AcrR family transcriptional regulator [Ensifer adhaerens]UAY07096.1 TetR/AcrR family transcriptional regulator [Ensifer adhaerens]